jgi:DUF1680 family protein
MFLLHGDGKYIDMLERALYNGAISGVALDGKTFFYPNPLASKGGYGRSKWFDCACCPTNICRFIPSVPGYVYAIRDNTLYVNLFVAGKAEIAVDGGDLRIEQKTAYPWDGRVTLALTPEIDGQSFELRVRIPGWANGAAFPTDLYTYLNDAGKRPTLQLNGKDVDSTASDKGYDILPARKWKRGDQITLDLPMPVRRVVAHEHIEADRGRAALMRGPIAYCIEWPDVRGGQVENLVLPDEKALTTEFRKDLLGGVQVITGSVFRIRQVTEANQSTEKNDTGSRQIPIMEEIRFSAIPYYAWAHRGPGQMAVWLARTANVLPIPAN